MGRTHLLTGHIRGDRSIWRRHKAEVCDAYTKSVTLLLMLRASPTVTVHQWQSGNSPAISPELCALDEFAETKAEERCEGRKEHHVDGNKC